MSEYEPRRPSDLEPVRWEDEDALFGAPSEDGDRDDVWLDELRTAEAERERIEQERRERARPPETPVVRQPPGCLGRFESRSTGR